MNIQKIIEKNRDAVVLVDVQKTGAEQNQKQISIRGTGFVINQDGRFITNAHVYNQISKEDLEYIGISIPGEVDEKNLTHYDRYPVKLLAIDEENDVALMQIVADGKKFKTVDGIGHSERLQEGEDIVFIGYPLATEMLNMGFGLTMTANKAMVSSIKRRGTDGSFHFFLIDGHINNGSSGSPVFSVETGKVVGIASAKISAKIQMPNGLIADIPANMGICRPIKYVESLLK